MALLTAKIYYIFELPCNNNNNIYLNIRVQWNIDNMPIQNKAIILNDLVHIAHSLYHCNIGLGENIRYFMYKYKMS